MSVFIEVNYAKKLGLPGYSSHQCSVTVRTELADISQLEKTSADLYSRLQAAVDSQIVNPGLVPTAGNNPIAPPAGSSSPAAPKVRGDEQTWRCSEKQRDLIIRIVDESKLDRATVDALAQERFGAGVRQLNKIQASALIDELLETHPDRNAGYRQGGRRGYQGRASR